MPETLAAPRKLYVEHSVRGQVRRRYVGEVSADGSHLSLYVHSDGGGHAPLPLAELIGVDGAETLRLLRGISSYGITLGQARAWIEAHVPDLIQHFNSGSVCPDSKENASDGSSTPPGTGRGRRA
jgi:hypothetical protein